MTSSFELPTLRPNREVPTYTYEEIRKRILNDEYLVIVDGYVIKINHLLKNHPGGSLALYHMIGKDATDEMRVLHPDYVFSERAPRYVVAKYAGDVEGVSFVEDLDLPYSKPSHVDPVLAKTSQTDFKAAQDDFRKLHVYLRQNGFFKTNYFNYLVEFSRFLLFAVGIFAFIFVGEMTTLKVSLSAICAAALWHQAAFSAHDFAHSALTANRVFDTCLGIFIGDFLGGLSVGWWKKSHNVHHIVTNQPENDPDIQHLPFFAITPLFLNNLFSTYYSRILEFDAAAKFLITFQDKMYYPLMMFGRFNLYFLSWSYLLDPGFVPYRYFEMACLSTFWVWYGWLLSHLPSWKLVLLHILLSHMLTAILHIQITLSHWGMSVASPNPQVETFVARQVRTSLDVICPPVIDWFHGGLQFQIEHHLFPRLPRHNLREVRPHVIALCEKHHMKYTEDYFLGANILTIKTLYATAQTVKNYVSKAAKLE